MTDSGLRYIIRNVGKEAGIDLHPHQLRHTLAMLAYEKGAPDAIVSKLLGHRSSRTTIEIYSIRMRSSLSSMRTRAEIPQRGVIATL